MRPPIFILLLYFITSFNFIQGPKQIIIDFKTSHVASMLLYAPKVLMVLRCYHVCHSNFHDLSLRRRILMIRDKNVRNVSYFTEWFCGLESTGGQGTIMCTLHSLMEFRQAGKTFSINMNIITWSHSLIQLTEREWWVIKFEIC